VDQARQTVVVMCVPYVTMASGKLAQMHSPTVGRKAIARIMMQTSRMQTRTKEEGIMRFNVMTIRHGVISVGAALPAAAQNCFGPKTL